MIESNVYFLTWLFFIFQAFETKAADHVVSFGKLSKRFCHITSVTNFAY